MHTCWNCGCKGYLAADGAWEDFECWNCGCLWSEWIRPPRSDRAILNDYWYYQVAEFVDFTQRGVLSSPA